MRNVIGPRSSWGWRAWLLMLVTGIAFLAVGIQLQYATFGSVTRDDGRHGLVMFSGKVALIEPDPNIDLIILWLDTDHSVYMYAHIPNTRLQLEPQPAVSDFEVGDQASVWQTADVPEVEAVIVKSSRTGAVHEFTTPEFRDAAQAAKGQAAAIPWLSVAAIVGGLALLAFMQTVMFRSVRQARGKGAARAMVGVVWCLAPGLTIYTFWVVVAASGQSSLSQSIYPIISISSALLWIGGAILVVSGFTASRHEGAAGGRSVAGKGFVAAGVLTALWLGFIGLAAVTTWLFKGIS